MATARLVDLRFDLAYPSDHYKFLQRLGERRGTEILVEVYNKGVPYNIAGAKLGFEMRNDNMKVMIDTDQSRFTKVAPLEGVFSYKPPENITGFFGNAYLAYFTFENGADRVTTERFRFYNDEDVQQCVAPELQEHYVSVIDDLVASNASAMAEAQAIRDLINAQGVVRKAGDTMTGNLGFQLGGSAKELNWSNGASALGRMTMHPSGLVEWFGRDGATERGAWNYSPSTNTFNVVSNTNLVKKAEVYTDYWQPNGNTKLLVAGTDLDTVQASGASAGSGLVNAPAGLQNFMYIEVLRYSDIKYCKQTATVLTGGSSSRIFTRRKVNDVWESWTETIQSTGGTVTGAMSFNGTVNHNNNVEQKLPSGQKGVISVVNDSLNKWAMAPIISGATDWTKEVALDLISGKLTVNSLAIKSDADSPIPLQNGATNPDTNIPPRCYRRGSSVQLTGSIRRLAGSASTVVGILPVGFRPAVDCNKYIVASDGTPVQLYIGASSGNVALSVADKTVQLNEVILINP